MKLLSVLFAVFILAAATHAAVFKVADDGTQTYSDIQSAINAATDGDSLVVMAGSYAGFTVDRKLVIIGSGTGTGIGESVFVNGIVDVEAEADSSELRSIWIRSALYSTTDSSSAILRIHSGADRIFIWRCFIDNSSAANNTACAFVGFETTAEFVQCVFAATGEATSSLHFGIRHRNNAAMTITSCIFSNCVYGVYDMGTTTAATITAQHCIFTCQGATQYPVSTDASGILENSLFLVPSGRNQYYTSSANITFSYCTANINIPPGPTSFLASDPAVVNLNYTDPRAADYHPAGGSNLIDTGNPGSPYDLDGSPADIGCYGGQHPYVDDGIPDYPFAVQVEVPYSAPLDGTMRIWGRGRVGPGN